jgi:hypothetical protein
MFALAFLVRHCLEKHDGFGMSEAGDVEIDS